jgi:hypothetical protein
LHPPYKLLYDKCNLLFILLERRESINAEREREHAREQGAEWRGQGREDRAKSERDRRVAPLKEVNKR